ncbi:hypothetical protein Pint_16863 [Pistacia integerrima]|uniref:Uncharacterized protein n=1 Tax=Pistacia integerrima TaxID=434235 RepID=A0ACC0ZEI4_9ROSI|nr:hypothetical protein Pint_16863 [Pistacia integerrima]
MFDWRLRRKVRASGKKKKQNPEMAELVISNHFQCPITLKLMKDPMTLSSGITYDRDNIETWLNTGNFTCTVTNQVLRSFDQILNHTLRKMIQDWKWGFESERNKLCIVANGVSKVLAKAFDAFAKNPEAFERFSNVLIEILSALNWMLLLDDNKNESLKLLTLQASLRCMVWFMKHSQDVLVKQNAISVLKEIKSFDQQEIEVRIDSRVDETLVKFLKEPISRTITKASLMVIFAMVSSPNENIKASFVEKGLVSLLLNLIVDSEKSICEKGLGVLDKHFESKEGREEAYQNALAMPVLVKKILRVSELATEFSVSAIWKLSKFDKKNEGKILFEALQVGVFQKLVLLLQCGYDDSTKEKTTQLLKLMNHRMH